MSINNTSRDFGLHICDFNINIPTYTGYLQFIVHSIISQQDTCPLKMLCVLFGEYKKTFSDEKFPYMKNKYNPVYYVKFRFKQFELTLNKEYYKKLCTCSYYHD